MQIMNINQLYDDLLLSIFSHFDLRTLRFAGETCRRWSKLTRRSTWPSLREVTLYELFERPKLPKGKHLNKALHWVLKRCGKNLTRLNLADPGPEYGCMKANERTFAIIGRCCPSLEELDFTCVLLLDDLLHEWVTRIDCSNLRRVNLNCSFNHFIAVRTGLSELYDACPRIEYLNISNSINARVQDCEELWPGTLKEVHINHAWALTGYSLWTLVKCCTELEVFSMSGNQSGMNGGLKYVLTRLPSLRVLRLDEYPGDVELGMQISELSNLRELYLAGSPMVTDRVLDAISRGCKLLRLIDLSVVPSGRVECTRNGRLTDEGLLALAWRLPSIEYLYLDGRRFITDHGLRAIASNGQLRSISLGHSDGITDATLDALGTNCASKLRNIRLSHLDRLTSAGVLRLCRDWFEKCSHDSGYQLDLHLDEIDLDMSEFRNEFGSVSTKNTHEFFMDGDRWNGPRRFLNLHCDMLNTMFS